MTRADGAVPTGEHVGDERTRESLEAFWHSMPADLRGQVEAVSMDMWRPYVEATRAQADIVHDSFHVSRYVNRALEEVRREESQERQARGDRRLKGTWQLWLWGFENLPARWAERFEPVRRVARLRREHAEQILTYFRHRFNNAIAELVNRRIQALIPKACGYRNQKRFKDDVLFHLGGLDLYPVHVL